MSQRLWAAVSPGVNRRILNRARCACTPHLGQKHRGYLDDLHGGRRTTVRRDAGVREFLQRGFVHESVTRRTRRRFARPNLQRLVLICNLSSKRDSLSYAVDMARAYTRSFYKEVDDGAVRSVAEVLPVVLEYVQPESVVDVGCGPGAWLAGFMKRGTSDVLGLDGPWVDADLLQIPRDRFQVVDLTQPLPPGRRFDLVVSLEVAEHLPPEAAETFIRSLTSLGSVVLFSAAIPYQGGTQHLNERWLTYWAGLFAAEGFTAIDCVRPHVWTNTRVDVWYAQNMFFAVDQAHLDRWPALAEAARSPFCRPRDLVHPRLFLQSTAYAKYPREYFHGLLGTIRDKWLMPSRRHAARRLGAAARWPLRQGR
jgi:SAM-dependent methyltransferase